VRIACYPVTIRDGDVFVRLSPVDSIYISPSIKSGPDMVVPGVGEPPMSRA